MYNLCYRLAKLQLWTKNRGYLDAIGQPLGIARSILWGKYLWKPHENLCFRTCILSEPRSGVPRMIGTVFRGTLPSLSGHAFPFAHPASLSYAATQNTCWLFSFAKAMALSCVA